MPISLHTTRERQNPDVQEKWQMDICARNLYKEKGFKNITENNSKKTLG